MLVELSVMEQRYQAVLAVVQDGWRVASRARPSTPGSPATRKVDWQRSRTTPIARHRMQAPAAIQPA